MRAFFDIRDLISIVVDAHQQQTKDGDISWYETILAVLNKGFPDHTVSYFAARDPFYSLTEEFFSK